MAYIETIVTIMFWLLLVISSVKRGSDSQWAWPHTVRVLGASTALLFLIPALLLGMFTMPPKHLDIGMTSYYFILAAVLFQLVGALAFALGEVFSAFRRT